ncbi:GNAT family N-acetyltransferase [Aquibacillus kalidii]|uniref:GNAT family N-acetyltransferase n=1 Tax=Aquibacillus kalidii TaxID=2762597 RepID=UPI0016480680|nr:GNAT family N-acetyltransferase [Aquibacillus kalidii]
MFTTRVLTPSDGESYLQLRLQALQKNPEAFASSYEEEKEQLPDKYVTRFQANSGSVTFGVLNNGELVGVVTLVKERLIKLQHRANVVAMYVSPDYRHKGLGKKLLSEVIQEAKNIEGIEQLYLSVVSTNISAKHLYKSFHFEVYGFEKRALKVGENYYDEEHMVLYLNNV